MMASQLQGELDAQVGSVNRLGEDRKRAPSKAGVVSLELLRRIRESKRPLNILYVHRTRGQNVEGVHIRGIVDSLREMGHEVRVLSVPGADPYANKDGKKASNKRRLRPRPPRWLSWGMVSRFAPQIMFEAFELSYNAYLYGQCLRAHREQPVDLIYERYALNTFSTTLFAKQHGIPIIHEINDATGIQRLRKHCAEAVASKIEDWIFENSNHLLTISSHFERILVNRGVSPEKISFQPNAVDETKFDPKRFNGRLREALGLKGKKVIGFIGCFARWHGLELLLSAAPQVIAKEPKAHFLLLGHGETFDQVERQIVESGLSDHFTLAGRIPAEKIPEYLSCMDIGVIPDSNEYGSPMKLFEYMAMGVVPVAPLLDPITDVIRHQETAMLFPRHDASALEAALIELCRNDHLRDQLKRRTRELTLARHCWKQNSARILALHRSFGLNPQQMEVLQLRPSSPSARSSGTDCRATA